MNEVTVTLSADWNLTNPAQTVSINNGDRFTVQCIKSNSLGEFVIQYQGTTVCMTIESLLYEYFIVLSQMNN